MYFDPSSPINPPPAINTGGRIFSRQVSAAQDAEVILFDVDVDDDTAWTIGFQELGTGSGELKIEYRRNLVTLESALTFGTNGGDFITGLGAFRAIIKGGLGGCKINGFWTLQPRIIDVGELADEPVNVASGAGFADLGTFGGFIPFPYNAVSIFSTAPTFELKLTDASGADIQSAMAITPPNTFVLDFQPPKNVRVRVSQGTGANQTFTALYTRQ
jgi:hypothetical protein